MLSSHPAVEMSEFTVQSLLQTASVWVRDVGCRGSCRSRGAEECTAISHLVFPYRGVYVRHLGSDEAVAEANQVVLFNRAEGYRVSHPVHGGDASLAIVVDDQLIRELAPRALLRSGEPLAFAPHRLRIDPRAQVLVALLRHSLRSGRAEPLEAESLTLTLVQRALGPRTTRAPGSTAGNRRLVDRAKLALTSDLSRRWTLDEVALEVGASPVYLTQIFQRVEGVPLYRYQLRLRLARALDLLAHRNDLSALALELGFSSHSHFSAAFRETYGCSPSTLRRRALQPLAPSAGARSVR